MTRSLRPSGKLSSSSRPSGQENIAAVLGSDILSGKRKPGDRMPSDAEMVKLFGVSRVVTREVIKTLAAKGMVASRMKIGTIVRDPSHWNWLDSDVLSWRVSIGLDLNFLSQITDVRRAVEPVAARLAALHRTPTDIVKLREAVDAIAHATEDRRLMAEADLRFHLTVCTASRNPFFQSFAGIIDTALSAMLSFNASADNAKTQAHTVETHSAVADAIEAGDPEAAAEAMQRTVDDGLSQAKWASKWP